MSMSLSLGNTANWELFYEDTFTRNYSLPITDTDYGMIGEKVIPILFDSPIISVTATTATGKPNWRQMGYAKQKVTLGLTVGGSVDGFINYRHLLSLNQPTLLQFDPMILSYALWFRPFNWFNDVTLKVHQYTGSLT